MQCNVEETYTLIKPNSIHLGDCIEGMKTMKPSSVDLIVTDPPFGIDFKANRANYNRTQSSVIQGYVEIKHTDYSKFTFDWIKEALRILKESGSMYIFSGYNNLVHILNAINHYGLQNNFQQLIWQYNFGVYTQRKWVNAHYNLIYVWKNPKKKQFYPNWRYTRADRKPGGGSKQYEDMESVWKIAREYWPGEQKTPNKLPASAIHKILGYSSKKGDIVCDPFLGSGQVAKVAKEFGRKYIGFEIVPAYYEFAQKQLEEIK